MKKLLGILLALTMLFTMGVPAMAEGETALELDYAALTRNSILTVASVDATLLDNLNLPTAGANGSTIAWASSDSSVISNTGVVTIPDFTKSVNLTATLSDGATEMKKVFAFRVPGKNDVLEPAHPMPAKGELIRKDDFNNNSIATSTIETVGAVAEENGKLHLSGTTGATTTAKIYLKEDKSAVTGEFIVEYTLYKNSLYGGMWVQNLSSKGSDYGYIYSFNYTENGENSLRLRGADADDCGRWSDFHYAQFGAPSTTLKFTILFDTDNGTYETWINNRYAAKRTRMSSGATDLGYVTFTNIGSLLTDYCIDDFACYEVKKDEVGRVVADEKFDGSTIPSRVENVDATVNVSGGTLNLSIPAGKTGANIYFNDGKTPLTGKFAVSFSVERTATSGTFDIYLQNAKGGDAVILRSYQSGDGILYRLGSAKGDSGSYLSIGSKSDTMDVYAEFDTSTQEVILTVNGVTKTGYTMDGKSNISRIQLYAHQLADLKVDNVKVTSLEENIEKASVIWQDSFSDGVVDEGFSDADVTESNGVLTVPKGKNVKKYFSNLAAYGKPITEDFVVEISVKGITADTQYYLYGDNATGGVSDFARVDWREDSNGIVYVFNGTELKSVSNVGTDNLNIKIAASIQNQTFSAWINGELVANNVKARNATKNISYFHVAADASESVSIDEIFFYSIKE